MTLQYFCVLTKYVFSRYRNYNRNILKLNVIVLETNSKKNEKEINTNDVLWLLNSKFNSILYQPTNTDVCKVANIDTNSVIENIGILLGAVKKKNTS